MKDITEKFIRQLQEQISINRDIANNEAKIAVDCAWQNLFQASQILFKCIDFNPKWDSNSVITVGFLILTNILSDILSALIITLSGFHHSPGVILRSVVENLACTIVIRNSPDQFEKYLIGNLPTNKTITHAKKIFPEIADYYGLYSNHYAHEKFDTIGRSLNPIGEDFDFTLLKETDKQYLPKDILLSISHLSRLTGALSEFCIAHLLKDFYYWRKSGNTLKEFKRTFEDKLLEKLINKDCKV